ncbi:MAG: hypothetical protein ACE5KE_00310 [Methanosarcinales archaeon]
MVEGERLVEGEITYIEGKPYLVEKHPIYGLRLKRVKTPEEIAEEREKLIKMLEAGAETVGKAVVEEAEKLGHAISEWVKKRKEKELAKEVR